MNILNTIKFLVAKSNSAVVTDKKQPNRMTRRVISFTQHVGSYTIIGRKLPMINVVEVTVLCNKYGIERKMTAEYNSAYINICFASEGGEFDVAVDTLIKEIEDIRTTKY